MDLTLRPMSRARLGEYLAVSMDEYVAELVDSGMEIEAARKNASDVTDESFPGGEVAAGNEIGDVLDGDRPVGILWITDRGSGSWWVYDIEIREEYRGKGYGRATMLLAEDRVRELGGRTLGLHVFGTNTTARGLYESLGYEPTNIQMRKQL